MGDQARSQLKTAQDMAYDSEFKAERMKAENQRMKAEKHAMQTELDNKKKFSW